MQKPTSEMAKSYQGSAPRLMGEYKTLVQEQWVNIEVCQGSYSPRIILIFAQLKNDSVYDWSVALMVLNPDSYYHGGYYKASLVFTDVCFRRILTSTSRPA